MIGIEIHGDPADKFLSISLRDILMCLGGINKAANWRLYALETLTISESPTITELENAVSVSENGISVDAHDIESVSNEAFQVLDIILMGGNGTPHLHFDENYKKTRTNYEYYIELFDSSYFIIYSIDELFIDCLKSRFSGIQAIEE